MSRRRKLTNEQCNELAKWHAELRQLGTVQSKARELGISVGALYDAISRGSKKPTAAQRHKFVAYLRQLSGSLREPTEVPCGTCGVMHTRIRRDGKTQYRCAPCHAAYMRENRPRHSELTDEQRLKANARSYANVYQKRGLLVKQPCVSCGSADAQKHHTDYSQPLMVTWLCRNCHMDEHFLESLKKETA